MSENPASKLLRIAGGLALLRGRLGHQALGQLLLSRVAPLEYAASYVTTAAATYQPSKVLEVAIRTGVPVAAQVAVAQRLQRLDAERAAALEAECDRLEQEKAELEKKLERLLSQENS